MTERSKILLADDAELFLEMERSFLQREDLDLLIARNGRVALEMIRTQRPQVAFLDMKMPGMSGLECCRSIKQDPDLAGTRVVMVINAGQPQELAACKEAGCDEVLLKPINHSKFLEMARQFLNLDVRAGRRLKAEIRVYYGAAPQKTLSDFSVDVSSGGLFLKTDFPLDVDEELTIRFTLPEQKKLVNCTGRVAWVNPKEKPRKPSMPTGMGVQFMGLSLDDLHAIRRFIEYNELEPSW